MIECFNFCLFCNNSFSIFNIAALMRGLGLEASDLGLGKKVLFTSLLLFNDNCIIFCKAVLSNRCLDAAQKCLPAETEVFCMKA